MKTLLRLLDRLDAWIAGRRRRLSPWEWRVLLNEHVAAHERMMDEAAGVHPMSRGRADHDEHVQMHNEFTRRIWGSADGTVGWLDPVATDRPVVGA